MHIVLIDDSMAFDALSPTTQPLGGAEKAFASLPGALAGRGHDVHVINRCRLPSVYEGARWHGWQPERAAAADVLIAFRKPALLAAAPHAGHRLLWLAAPARSLERPDAAPALAAARPTLVFLGPAHRATWRPADGTLAGLGTAVIPPGVREAYRPALEPSGPPMPVWPPRAVVTAHPSHGLAWVLESWPAIRHEVPEAELHLYSALLVRGLAGEALPPATAAALAPLVARVKQAVAVDNVFVHRPGADADMAAAYHAARVHLHPSHADDMACWTLGESQACGLPAVARPLGAAAERLVDGSSGYLVPDAEALANVASLVLQDDTLHARLSAEAGTLGHVRTWDAAAAEFEALWS